MKMKLLVVMVGLQIYLMGYAQPTVNPIALNQLGFYPGAPKLAIVMGETSTATFYILSSNLMDTLYTGRLSGVRLSANSSTKTRIADFSSFKKNGHYILSIPGKGNSWPFEINQHVLGPVARASLKGFYYQRSSIPLEADYAGIWHRPAGHPDTAVLIHPSAASAERPAGTVISTPGGWYDAGDYNKYVVNSGITMGTLLSAYEDFSRYFDTLRTNIPQLGDQVPDLVNEIIYNLRWMLTMQDPADGGVYNKCTNAAFDGMVMPGVTKLPRWVVQKGTAATLDFAAVTAQAARVLEKFERQLPGLKDSCLKAAKSAWKWSLQHPALEYNQSLINQQFEPKITTGGYGDRKFTDEWFWAACELYASTGDEAFYQVVSPQLADSLTLPSWGNVYLLGNYTLLRSKKYMPAAHPNDINRIRKKLVALADGYLLHVKENAFQTIMGHSKTDFNWGSNANAANQGIVMVNAWFITRDKKYLDDALGNLDYLMGRNATGFCFVTGIGSKSTLHPHHRPSVADGIEAPVPGLLAGGPNPGRQDGCPYEFTEPETAYSDNVCAYASNEIAINWNAPLVYLSNAVEALQFQVGYSSPGKESSRKPVK